LAKWRSLPRTSNPFEIAVGNRAKRLKFRFPPEIISRIEKSQWWHWNHDLIKERLNEFNDVIAFFERYGQEIFLI
jgi:hypothetical protein